RRPRAHVSTSTRRSAPPSRRPSPSTQRPTAQERPRSSAPFSAPCKTTHTPGRRDRARRVARSPTSAASGLAATSTRCRGRLGARRERVGLQAAGRGGARLRTAAAPQGRAHEVSRLRNGTDALSRTRTVPHLHLFVVATFLAPLQGAPRPLSPEMPLRGALGRRLPGGDRMKNLLTIYLVGALATAASIQFAPGSAVRVNGKNVLWMFSLFIGAIWPLYWPLYIAGKILLPRKKIVEILKDRPDVKLGGAFLKEEDPNDHEEGGSL